MAKKRTAVKDGFANVAKNIGTPRDPAAHGTYQLRQPHHEQELVAAYRTTWLARRIVDIVPEDATREWRSWKADAEDITKIEDYEKAQQVQRKVKRAMSTARLLGGAAIYMSTADAEGRTAEPFEPGTVGIGGLRKLVVLGRRQLVADHQSINQDPDSDYYGEPEIYYTGVGNGDRREIHVTRLVRFWGTEMPEGLTVSTDISKDGWADSCLESLFDAVRDTDSAMANLASMIYEAKTDVVKVKNLMSSMMNVPEYEAALIKRFQLAALAKGTNGLLLLDEQDEWDQKQLTFGGLPDVVDRFFQWVSGGSGIPVTRLFMRSPAGLNATGESDIRTYYDNVRAMQTNEIAPELDKLDRAMKVSVYGAEREDVYYEWNSLWQPTFDEKAESSKRVVDIGKSIVDSGLMPTEVVGEAVANTLIEIGTLSGLEQILEDAPDPFAPDEDGEGDEDALGGQPPVGTEQPNNVVPLRQAVGDAAPRTLYISRKLVNGAEVLAHYAEQGFDVSKFLDPDDLHVTIAYSRTPLDWAKAGEPWQDELKVIAGGMRIQEQLGKAAPLANVLLFTSSSLAWRHEEVKDAGGSWDHPEYQPHVTLSYEVDLSAAVPYRGELVFGPEIWEEVDEDWKSRVTGDEENEGT